ncbi:Uncharacterised protein [Mycobacterium tuberculosis]|nr:Uncharacterised protein [Mycobacterium tuberculosis]
MAMMVDEVSVPSRGFGSDDKKPANPAQVVRKVSVPSRGFGSDDKTEIEAGNDDALVFPSPLGVLGLTTRMIGRRMTCY